MHQHRVRWVELIPDQHTWACLTYTDTTAWDLMKFYVNRKHFPSARRCSPSRCSNLQNIPHCMATLSIDGGSTDTEICYWWIQQILTPPQPPYPITARLQSHKNFLRDENASLLLRRLSEHQGVINGLQKGLLMWPECCSIWRVQAGPICGFGAHGWSNLQGSESTSNTAASNL